MDGPSRGTGRAGESGAARGERELLGTARERDRSVTRSASYVQDVFGLAVIDAAYRCLGPRRDRRAASRLPGVGGRHPLAGRAGPGSVVSGASASRGTGRAGESGAARWRGTCLVL